MLLTSLKRILRSGFVNFWRNGFVSAASVLVMTVTLFVLGSLVFVNAMLDASLEQIQQKVDVNVYFTLDATADEMQDVQEQLEAREDVEGVEFISREQALEEFREKRLAEGDDVSLQALEELDENPLPARLNIQAADTTDYEAIATFLESEGSQAATGRDVVDKVNFFQNKQAIDALTRIINSVDTLSIVVLIVFMVIAVLIVFNTIRLAIYTSREEIGVMRLVGASNMYIRGPFIIEGIMYGVIGAIVSLILFYPVALWVGPYTQAFFGTTNAFDYYVDNFAEMFILLIVVGIVLGAISSFLAIKKYLKV